MIVCVNSEAIMGRSGHPLLTDVTTAAWPCTRSQTVRSAAPLIVLSIIVVKCGVRNKNGDPFPELNIVVVQPEYYSSCTALNCDEKSVNRQATYRLLSISIDCFELTRAFTSCGNS